MLFYMHILQLIIIVFLQYVYFILFFMILQPVYIENAPGYKYITIPFRIYKLLRFSKYTNPILNNNFFFLNQTQFIFPLFISNNYTVLNKKNTYYFYL
ncbi:hypothetical protein BDA99DRAFT_529124 [Phascolomyces articulosus]|uniref:Uncharacterized protein n=1 Tax=Phascolomyces articulosus TaxID=60185 RepID=A0AAD5P785_9FUNG|nr:hypothetical protein BDA99DRAFT_529124 [Phascolomyces articulosus]